MNTWGKIEQYDSDDKSYKVVWDLSFRKKGKNEIESFDSGINNYIYAGSSVKRSSITGTNKGEWRNYGRNGFSLSEDDPAPHEVGHLFGLRDRYKDVSNGTSAPNKGWETNIMGNSRNGTVDKRNIYDIVKDAMNKYEIWKLDPENKDKTFKYEIDP